MADDHFFARLSLVTLRLLVSIRVATITVLKQLAGTLVKCLPVYRSTVFSTPGIVRITCFVLSGIRTCLVWFGRYNRLYSFVISARVSRASLCGTAGGCCNGEFPLCRSPRNPIRCTGRRASTCHWMGMSRNDERQESGSEVKIVEETHKIVLNRLRRSWFGKYTVVVSYLDGKNEPWDIYVRVSEM